MNSEFHFIGIGGIGMSGLAHLLLDRNQAVAGSDLKENSLTRELASRGASIAIGRHRAENVSSACTVVYATGVTVENPEYQRAIALGHPLVHRSDLLWKLAQEQMPL